MTFALKFKFTRGAQWISLHNCNIENTDTDMTMQCSCHLIPELLAEGGSFKVLVHAGVCNNNCS